MIEFSRKLSNKAQAVAPKVIQQNGFHAHPENVLKSMLADENVSFWEKAVENIIYIRNKRPIASVHEEEGKGEEEEEEGEGEEGEEEEEDEEKEMEEEDASESKTPLPLDLTEKQAFKNNSIRKFEVPKINVAAKTYPDLFEWNSTPFFGPSLTPFR